MTTSANLDTREISRDEWVSFFDDFSEKHRGWRVSIEEISAKIGDQEGAAHVPFVGISADLKDQENRISVIVGGKVGSDMNRIINMPEHVWFRHSSMDQYDVIDIETEDGAKTLLHFRFGPAQ